jgi:hypothetical protein
MIRAALVLALVGVLMVLWRRTVNEVPSRWQRSADVVEVLVLGGLILIAGLLAIRNLMDPYAWDFPVFYTVAHNVIDGVSFYDPAALLPTFEEIQRTADVPADWLTDGFGFWYAPPTALILAPVGAFGYTEALGLQFVIQGAMLVVSVILLHRVLPLRGGAMGLVEMGVLIMAFRPVIEAFVIGQIVFGALLAIVVALTTIRDRPVVAGVALGIGALFKHLLVIPAVLVLAMGRARTTVAAGITMLGAAAIAAVVFGISVYEEFATFGPSDRPPSIALDSVIQSLNGVMRRTFDAVPASAGALDATMYPPYLVVGGLLTLVTLAIVWRVRDLPETTLLAFSFIVTLSLIVYPNTLYNTLALVLPAIIVIVVSSKTTSIPGPITLAVVMSTYLVVVSWVVPGFLVLVIVWTYLAVVLGRTSVDVLDDGVDEVLDVRA